jgi:hypothetical protein
MTRCHASSSNQARDLTQETRGTGRKPLKQPARIVGLYKHRETRLSGCDTRRVFQGLRDQADLDAVTAHLIERVSSRLLIAKRDGRDRVC